MIKKLDWRKWK